MNQRIGGQACGAVADPVRWRAGTSFNVKDDDLTLGRIYEMLGVEGSGSFYRIVDDSGEDYLYPASHFRKV